MAINFYPHHIGDYSKHTKQLTLLEHGAYRLLLDFYYTCEGAFANDLQMLYRACSAHTPTERRAIQKILSKYFSPRDGAWRHPRADEEIKKISDRSQLARDKANKRHAGAGAGAEPGQCYPLANSHKPDIIYKQGGSNGRKRNGVEEGDRLAEHYESQGKERTLDA